MLTTSAKPSIDTAEESSERTPREVITVIAPKASGMIAAIGERKTSSRTSSRIGRAISSLRWVAWIDSSWIARERVAKPVCVALTGGVTFSSRISFEFVDGVADRVLDADVEVDEDQRLVLRRPQVADFALVPGRDGRHFRVRGAQRMNQLRTLFFDRLRRALEEDRERRRVTEVLLEHLVGAVRVRARHVERRRVQLALDVAADPAEHDDRHQGDHQDRAWPPKRQRQPALPAASH